VQRNLQDNLRNDFIVSGIDLAEREREEEEREEEPATRRPDVRKLPVY
jgi:hypothetical protein